MNKQRIQDKLRASNYFSTYPKNEQENIVENVYNTFHNEKSSFNLKGVSKFAVVLRDFSKFNGEDGERKFVITHDSVEKMQSDTEFHEAYKKNWKDRWAGVDVSIIVFNRE